MAVAGAVVVGLADVGESVVGVAVEGELVDGARVGEAVGHSKAVLKKTWEFWLATSWQQEASTATKHSWLCGT